MVSREGFDNAFLFGKFYSFGLLILQLCPAEAKLVSCKVAMEELQLASVDGVPMEWLCGFFPKNPAAMEAAEIAVKDFPIL